jgi:hypothetical protein
MPAPNKPLERTIRFPADRLIGTVYHRAWGAVFAPDTDPFEGVDWISAGDAQGSVTVPQGQEAMLRVSEDAEEITEGLGAVSEGDVQYLDLRRTAISDREMDAVARLKGLVALDLSGTALSDEGMAHLENCAQLQCIYCPPGIGAPGLEPVSHHKLRRLVLKGCKALNDDTAARLMVLLNQMRPTLKFVDLTDTGLTDSGLYYIEQLNFLERLLISQGTGVTDAGLEQLRKAMPYCEVS